MRVWELWFIGWRWIRGFVIWREVFGILIVIGVWRDLMKFEVVGLGRFLTELRWTLFHLGIVLMHSDDGLANCVLFERAVLINILLLRKGNGFTIYVRIFYYYERSKDVLPVLGDSCKFIPIRGC